MPDRKIGSQGLEPFNTLKPSISTEPKVILAPKPTISTEPKVILAPKPPEIVPTKLSRKERVRQVIRSMLRSGKDLTVNGQPEARMLAKLSGEKISAEERDTLTAEVFKEG